MDEYSRFRGWKRMIESSSVWWCPAFNVPWNAFSLFLRVKFGRICPSCGIDHALTLTLCVYTHNDPLQVFPFFLFFYDGRRRRSWRWTSHSLRVIGPTDRWLDGWIYWIGSSCKWWNPPPSLGWRRAGPLRAAPPARAHLDTVRMVSCYFLSFSFLQTRRRRRRRRFVRLNTAIWWFQAMAI